MSSSRSTWLATMVRATTSALGTAVGEGNLIMFSSLAIASQFPVEQFRDFQVLVPSGTDVRSYAAEYLGKDDVSQVAFVRTTDAAAPALPVLEFDETATVQVGDPVVSFGTLGEPDAYAPVMQQARLSARIEKPFPLYLAIGGLGSVGTPVFTLDGKALGIVGVRRINRGSNAKPNWATVEVLWPVARFAERLKDPPQGGKAVKHPWLGVETLTPVTKDMADYFKLGDRRGIVVGQVIENSPADKAGIKAEDIILALNGKNITGTEGQLVEAFANDLKQMRVGQEAVLDIWRDGKTLSVKPVLDAPPKSPAEAERYHDARFGLVVREMVLMDTLARELPTNETGVVVAFLERAGWAQDGGLQVGDVIKKVQDQEVKTLADFKGVFQAEVAKKPKEIVLFVLRGKKDTQVVRLEPRWDAAKPSEPGEGEGENDQAEEGT